MQSRVKSFRGEGQDAERHVVGGVWRAERRSRWRCQHGEVRDELHVQ